MNTPIKKRLSGTSKILLFLCTLMLLTAVFVPLWRIELDAPQYPEGLELLIYPHKLGGNVEIINGLNHYIGMRTLHSEEFVEFTVLPYIIGAFALFSLIAALSARKSILYALLASFVIFGVVAMIDFYRWEYEYGHDLDPNAAIIVPGMAYQPPLIGFKQLLNFGAFSVPAAGGWLFIASGVLMLLSVIIEKKMSSRSFRNVTGLVLLSSLFFPSCAPSEPQPVSLNKDNCAYCKMTISDPRFATQLITKKGRVYKFDDLSCMDNYVQEQTPGPHTLYIANFVLPDQFILLNDAILVSGENVSSPMGGNIAAFKDQNEAQQYAGETDGTVLDKRMTWKE